MSFQGSMKSLKLYENFGLHVYFSGGKGPELLSETLTLSHCTPSPESLSGTHEASCPTGPSVFSPPLSPLLSSSPSPRMRGRAILYVDLVPLHLHPGPWNPSSLLPSIHIHAQSTLHGPLPRLFPRALCWRSSYARGAKNLSALQTTVWPLDTLSCRFCPFTSPSSHKFQSGTQKHGGTL